MQRLFADTAYRTKLAYIEDNKNGPTASEGCGRWATLKLGQRRLADIERQIGNLRGHLREAPPDLAQEFYADLRSLVQQRKQAQEHLGRLRMGHDPNERQHLNAVERMVTGVDDVWAAASTEEKKAILKGFVRRADLSADLDSVAVQIRIPVLFGELADVVRVELPDDDRRKTPKPRT